MPGALDLTIALPGVPSMRVALSRLRADIADWTPFWRDSFSPAFYRHVAETFAAEGGNTGFQWSALTPAYAKWKAARFPGNRVLVLHGTLQGSLIGPSAPQAIFRPTQTSLEIGTTVPYGILHQLGTRRMVARPPLRMTSAFMAALGKDLQRYVQTIWSQRRAESKSTGEAA